MDARARENGHGQLRIGENLVDPARGLIRGPAGEARLEPKVMDVLCALAGRGGEVVTREELIESIWKVEYGGDESVTRAVSILRKALGDPRVIETLPKRGYRFTADVTPVLAEAPQENGGTDEPAAPVETDLPRLRRAWLALIAAIALAVVVAAAVFFRRDAEVASVFAPDGRIDVRALEVIAEGPEARRFARGLNDAVVRALAASRVESVRRGSAEAAAAVPQAEFALDGSVDRENDRYLVTVRIDALADGATLWSKRFERSADEAIDLQSQTASQAAHVLQCALRNRAPHVGEMSLEVLALFLKACAEMGVGETDNFIRMHDLARRIVAAAPDLAASQALFAASNAFAIGFPTNTAAEREAFQAAAREAAARALELNPENGEAYYALAIALHLDWAPTHWLEFESHLRKSQDLDPEFPYTITQLIWLARGAGRVAEATALAERAVALDPYSPFKASALAWLLAMEGRLIEADKQLARAEIFWPNSEVLKDYRLQIATWHKPPDVAERMLSEPDALREGTTEAEIACTRAILEVRRRGTMGASADAFRESDCFTERRNEHLARLLSSVGDADGAYRELERVDFEWFGSTIFLFFPEMRSVRRDPRFMPLAARIGLVDYWLETDRWPDFCAEPDLPYDCKEIAHALQTDGKAESAPAKSG